MILIYVGDGYKMRVCIWGRTSRDRKSQGVVDCLCFASWLQARVLICWNFQSTPSRCSSWSRVLWPQSPFFFILTASLVFHSSRATCGPYWPKNSRSSVGPAATRPRSMLPSKVLSETTATHTRIVDTYRNSWDIRYQIVLSVWAIKLNQLGYLWNILGILGSNRSNRTNDWDSRSAGEFFWRPNRCSRIKD